MEPNIESSRGVCRDFLRNVCTRRDSCKFAHVIPSIEFCHDFQNTGTCGRKHCKYTHGTYKDEQHYLANGALPQHLKPMCLNYLKNKCTRVKCKFLHPPSGNSTNETACNGQVSNDNGEINQTNNSQIIQPTINSESSRISKETAESNGKNPVTSNVFQNIPPNGPGQSVHYLGVGPKKSKRSVKIAEVKAVRHFLSQENEFLKMKLQEMGEHLAQMQSNNEYLLQENQRLTLEAQVTNRVTTLGVQHSATSVTALAVPHSSSMAIAVPHSASVTALAVPHSGTNVTALAVPHSSSMAIAVPHSASVTALAVPHSATNVTALAVPHSSSMAIAVPAMTITNTKQQVMGGTTFAAVPVSIATMTTGTPVSITTGTPVSIATVSMAPMQIPPIMSVPASLEQTSVLYPILTQMCTK